MAEPNLLGEAGRPKLQFRVTREMVTAARVRLNPTETQRQKIFAPPKPPPGVLPKNQSLAMDELVGETLSWAASGSGYGGAWGDGSGFLGYAALSELAQIPEYRTLSEVIASEMTREWIEFKSKSDDGSKHDKIEKIEDALKQLDAQDVCAQGVLHDGFFGRGHIYLDTGQTDDPEEMKQDIGGGRGKLSKSKVSPENPLKRLANVEPLWTYPARYDSVNPLKKDWYDPEQWYVMGQEVHRSRLLRLVGRPVPDLLKPAYSFGGLSMSQMARPYVNNWLRTRQSVADIVHAFSVMVLSTDMMSTMELGGDQLLTRLELFNLLRDNRGIMAINKDTEEFQNVSAPLGGLEGLQAQSQEHLAAVSRIPLVKLLGIQPAGLNASSEGEIRSFYDWIAAFQGTLLHRPLTTIIDFVQLSLFGEVDEDITWDFKSLWQLDEAGKAAIQKTKADTRDVDIAAGVISPEEGRLAAVKDPDSQYTGLNLEETPAPGLDPESGTPEEEEEDLRQPGLTPFGARTGERPPLGGPRASKGNGLASGITSRAAKFGGAGSGV